MTTDFRPPTFVGEDGGADPLMAAYVFGVAGSFGISHIDAIHTRLLRIMPTAYSALNVVLPCGRAIFLLAFLQRGVVNQERASAAGDQRRSSV